MTEQLSYTDVKNVNLTPLREAVTKWGQAPGKFQQVGTNFSTDVTKGLVDSNWEGESAEAAAKKFSKIDQQIRAAAEESRRIHMLLKDGVDEIASAKRELDGIEEELQGHRHLRLNTQDGSVYLDLPAEEEDDRSTLTKSYQETFAHYRERTRRAVEKASKADSALASALTADVNGTARGFNSKAYSSLDQAREQTAKDLAKALELAELKPGEMNPTQLAEVDAVLARHSQDPHFSERFATSLEPRKTLEFWYNATHPQGPVDTKAWLKAAKNLQQSLGLTLATASHSGSPEMQQWKNQILRLGPVRMDSGGAFHPYGFQVMSNLMRFGKYDTDFLTRYGDKLISFDKKHNDKFGAWSNPSDATFLNLHGKAADNGMDPMTGFLEGLGHNPEASTEFFKQPDDVKGIVSSDDELNDNFTYLARDRNWHVDGNVLPHPTEMAGHEALGHALLSATTGYAWDDDALTGKDPEIFRHGGDKRTAETAGVMEQVVFLYGDTDGNGPELLHQQPGMADSLGRMGGAYVDDLNHNVSGVGDSANKDDGAFPGAYEGRADFGRFDSIGFLSLLGQDEESYRVMTQAEHIYTLSRLDSVPPTSAENLSVGERVLKTEAEVRGTLDHSRAEQAEATYGKGSDAANESIGRSADWKKTLIGTAIWTGTGVALIPVTGPSGGAVIAPIAANASMDLINEFIGQDIDSAVEEESSDERSAAKRNHLFHQGETDLGAAMSDYLHGHEVGEDRENDFREAIKSNYLSTGPNGASYEGHSPS